MKRLMVSLWMAGAVVYMISTLLFTNAVLIGNSDDPKPVTVDVKSPEPAPVQAAQIELESIAPAAAETPHAVSPDPAPTEVPGVPPQPSSVPLAEQPPAVEEAQVPSTPALDQTERLKVTSAASIRSGPSTSNDVIGTAQAGAQVQVVSRDSGWVQFIDPASGRGGWIYSGLLEPWTTSSDTASTETSRAEQSTPAVSSKQRGKPRAAPNYIQRGNSRAEPNYVELPSDGEFVPRRRFGILGKRRMMRDAQLPPWEEDLPPRYRRR